MVRVCGIPAAFICLVAFTSAITAQAQRYELGRRLRSFESAWESVPGADARKRTVTPLNHAVTAFFTFRLGEAGRAIDRARFALDDSLMPTSAQLWAESLAIFPATRLVDIEMHEIALDLNAFYDVPKPAEAEFLLRVSLKVAGKETSSQSLPIKELPLRCQISVKNTTEGDHCLHYEILQKKEKLAHGDLQVSFVSKLAERVESLKKIEAGGAETATERATLLATLRLVGKFMEGKTEETDYPITRLLREAELMGKSIKAREPFFKKDRSGEYWLSLSLRKDPESAERVFPLRVLTPAKWNDKVPTPLVVALHGAGGSENLFFDGYGNGKIARLCKERGWMLVAPRVSFNLSSSLGEVLDELHKRWPFHRNRVFIVGHSMGAAQALHAVSIEPRRYAAVIALGGSGTFKTTEELKKVPFYVGVGNQDFALSGARGLRDRLVKAGVEKVTYRELANIEHLGIVQQTLAEAFENLDAIAKMNWA
jgi:predicted esterase